jgi:pimeloyl-ACP methyl ester carboxylesterase
MGFAESDDGVRVRFEITGKDRAHGPHTSFDPVLVIPGGPCRGPEYLGDLAGFADLRPLAVLYPRGSEQLGDLSRGWWRDAADAIAVANTLGLVSFHVLAHSAGTRAALALTAQFRSRIRSLVLVTPAAAWLTGTPNDGVRVAARRNEPEIAAALTSMTTEPADEAEFQRALKIEAPAGYSRWTQIEQRHAAVGGMSLSAVHAWFRDIPDDAVAQILGTKMAPVLVLGGAEDILSGVEPVHAYAAALGAELRMLNNCGHYPWVERPEAFRAELGRWFRIHDSRSTDGPPLQPAEVPRSARKSRREAQ